MEAYGARVRPEAEHIAAKHRGQMGAWLNHEDNRNYQSPRPEPRVTENSKEYYERNKGVINDCIQGHRAPPIDRKIHPRGVSSDGAGMARVSKGGRMEQLVQYRGGEMPDTSRPAGRAVKGQGEEYAERNKGSVSKLFHKYGTMPISDREPRIQPGQGAENYKQGQGPGMGPILRQDAPRNPSTPGGPSGKLHSDSENWIAPSPRVYEPTPAPEGRTGPMHKDSENWIEHDPKLKEGPSPKFQQNRFWQPSEQWPPDRNMGNFTVRTPKKNPMYAKSDGWAG